MANGNGLAAVYLRISQDRDAERAGVERQLGACRELAKRLGWTVGQIFEDNDASAFRKSRRPAYEALVTDIQAGKWSRLITLHPDRLYRRALELERLIPILDGVDVRTVRAGDIDLATATGRQLARIVGATNQGESERMSERIKAKMAELTAKGAWKGGPRPFGWNADGITENRVEVKLLREAKDRILRGETLRAICIDWKARGVKSPRGKLVSQTSLRKMLVSPRLVGRYARRDGSIIGPGQWKAIITEDDWGRLRYILLDGNRNTRRRREPTRYLLTGGLLRCTCGAALVGRPSFGGRPTAYYGCPERAADGPGKHVHIRVPVADELVERSLLLRLDSKEFAKRRAQMVNQAPDLARALDELRATQERSTELAAAYGDGVISKSEWLTAKSRLEPRLEAAQKALDAAQTGLGLMLATVDARELVEDWAELPVERRRSVIRLLIERVDVQPHHGPVRRLDPDRLQIVWRV